MSDAAALSVSIPVALVQTPIAALVVQDCHVTLCFVGKWPMTEAMLKQLPSVSPFESLRPICRTSDDWVVGTHIETGELARIDWDEDTDWVYDEHTAEERQALIDRGGRVATAVAALPLIMLVPS